MMDAITKNLLVEVARAVLRVLDVDSLSPSVLTREEKDAAYRKYVADHPTPWATANNTEAQRGAPAVNTLPAMLERLDKAMPTVPKQAERGSSVRVWTGDRYESGKVEAIARDKVTLTVRISRGEGRRDKVLKVHREKAVVL